MTHPENCVFLLAVMVYDLCSEGQKIPRASSSMTQFKQTNLPFSLRFIHIPFELQEIHEPKNVLKHLIFPNFQKN